MKKPGMLTTIVLFVACIVTNAIALDQMDNVTVKLRPVNNDVREGSPIVFFIDVGNDTGQNIYLLESYWFEKPSIWEEGNITIRLGYMFTPNFKGYEFQLPPFVKIKPNPKERLGTSFYGLYYVIESPYWINLSEIKGMDVINLKRKVDNNYIFVNKYSSRVQDWDYDIKLKPGMYKFRACVSYVDNETIRYFEDVLEKEEESSPFHLSSECASWDKRIKYLRGHLRVKCSDSESLRILP